MKNITLANAFSANFSADENNSDASSTELVTLTMHELDWVGGTSGCDNLGQ